MSIFPFTSDLEEAPEKELLPVFKEMAYDYEHNCLLRRGGIPYLVEKDEALQVWIYKTLQTQRYVWPAYSRAYGNELDQLIGLANTRDLADSEAKRYITEALMVNPYIQELSGFTFDHQGSRLTAAFEVTSVYGRFTYQTEVYNE